MEDVLALDFMWPRAIAAQHLVATLKFTHGQWSSLTKMLPIAVASSCIPFFTSLETTSRHGTGCSFRLADIKLLKVATGLDEGLDV